jgi:iron complex transport system permease protein
LNVTPAFGPRPYVPARWLLTGAAALLAASLSLAVAFGTEPVSIARALFDDDSLDHVIVFRARLPRVLLGVVSGAGLAAAGASFQSVLRNPLAEPYVLGVSGGAALGATLVITMGMSGVTAFGAGVVPLAALAGGLAATVLVYALARAARDSGGHSILLAGIVVNAIASAIITFIKTVVSASKAQELIFWLMGFLDVPSPAALIAVTAYVLAGSAVLLWDAGRLNLLALGNDAAMHLGVDVRALERRTFVACSCIVGAIVSVTGLIGFIGLVVPQAVRRLSGPDLRVLLPASLLVGGAALVAFDLASRALFRWLHTEPPVGAVTAMVGGPMFLWLLVRRRVQAS